MSKYELAGLFVKAGGCGCGGGGGGNVRISSARARVRGPAQPPSRLPPAGSFTLRQGTPKLDQQCNKSPKSCLQYIKRLFPMSDPPPPTKLTL